MFEEELFNFQRDADHHFGVILFARSRDLRELFRKQAVIIRSTAVMMTSRVTISERYHCLVYIASYYMDFPWYFKLFEYLA